MRTTADRAAAPEAEVIRGAHGGADDGETLHFAGMNCRPIVRPEDSGGAYAMVEITAEPGEASPPQVSSREDRALYIVESAFRIQLGDRSVTLGPGASVRIHRGMPHAFKCVGYETGRVLVSYTPAGQGREPAVC